MKQDIKALTAILLSMCLLYCGIVIWQDSIRSDSIVFSNTIKNEVRDNPNDTVIRIFCGNITLFYATESNDPEDMLKFNNQSPNNENLIFGFNYLLLNENGGGTAKHSAFDTNSVLINDKYRHNYVLINGKYRYNEDYDRWKDLLKYVFDPHLIFDDSVTIEEIYLMQQSYPPLAARGDNYIYYVTDKGDYILMFKSYPIDIEWNKKYGGIYSENNFAMFLLDEKTFRQWSDSQWVTYKYETEEENSKKFVIVEQYMLSERFCPD